MSKIVQAKSKEKFSRSTRFKPNDRRESDVEVIAGPKTKAAKAKSQTQIKKISTTKYWH